jgi:hypothetical protein
MRITSSGFIGLAGNTTPDNAVSIGEVASIAQDVNSFYAGTNFTSTGVNFKKTGNYAQQLHFDSATGSCIFKATASTGTAGNAISWAERARIDSSGRLLVGTSSDSGGALLQVNGDRVRIATAKTPASASDTGTAGEICWDANYIYVCTATNTWKRTAIATW